jgi:hypothetical protein
MKRVIGLGGIFFKAKDPKALYEWYRKHLGIEGAEGSGAIFRDEVPSVNVWSIFPQDTNTSRPASRASCSTFGWTIWANC